MIVFLRFSRQPWYNKKDFIFLKGSLWIYT